MSASFPFRKLLIEIAGSFQLTNKENNYIMVVDDYFTKYTVSLCLHKQRDHHNTKNIG